MKASLYFHIPFCTKKCPYCHFYVIPNRQAYHKLLKESLDLEWKQKLPLLQNKAITSIYFGGGTPSLFREIEGVLKTIQTPILSDCEITIEANPEDSSFELFSHFIEIGINRISLGVQSLDDRSLMTLERTHTAKKAKEAIWNAKKAGFKNISIDLMYDLPGQTEESWLYTLNQLSQLPIQHLSLYNLTIEPGTVFYKKKAKTPSGDLSFKFLMSALEKFEKMGFKRYEISAFSLPGFESKHNLGYWTGRPFLGFGPSAFSFWEGARFRNVANIHKYACHLKENISPIDFQEKLPYPKNVKELLAIHLRVKEGVDIDQYDLPDDGVIGLLIEQGFLIQSGKTLKLTDKGMLYYDTVATELI